MNLTIAINGTLNLCIDIKWPMWFALHYGSYCKQHYKIVFADIRKCTINFVNRELNQKLMEAESELDDVRNQKSAGEIDTDSELGRKYTDHL